MQKFKTLLLSMFFLGISIHSISQISIGAGTIFNKKANQLGLQIRLEKTYHNWATQIKYEKYFLGEGLDLFAIRAGFNFEMLERKNYSIYTITELNLTGVEGLDIFIFEGNQTSGSSFGGNLGIGFQFFFDKKQNWKLFTESDILFISQVPKYFHKRPFKRYLQVALGVSHNF